VKLLLENWRKYLKEEDVREDAEDLNLLQGLINDIFVVVQAAEDSAGALEEARPGSKARRRKRASQYIRKIKREAGLVGIAKRDFTSEQVELYKKTTEVVARTAEVDNIDFLTTLAYGDILKLPLIRQLVEAGGPRLKGALAAVMPECAEGLSLTCLSRFLVGQGGEME
jgi:hydroxypyruvate isomerase